MSKKVRFSYEPPEIAERRRRRQMITARIDADISNQSKVYDGVKNFDTTSMGTVEREVPINQEEELNNQNEQTIQLLSNLKKLFRDKNALDEVYGELAVSMEDTLFFNSHFGDIFKTITATIDPKYIDATYFLSWYDKYKQVSEQKELGLDSNNAILASKQKIKEALFKTDPETAQIVDFFEKKQTSSYYGNLLENLAEDYLQLPKDIIYKPDGSVNKTRIITLLNKNFNMLSDVIYHQADDAYLAKKLKTYSKIDNGIVDESTLQDYMKSSINYFKRTKFYDPTVVKQNQEDKVKSQEAKKKKTLEDETARRGAMLKIKEGVRQRLEEDEKKKKKEDAKTAVNAKFGDIGLKLQQKRKEEDEKRLKAQEELAQELSQVGDAADTSPPTKAKTGDEPQVVTIDGNEYVVVNGTDIYEVERYKRKTKSHEVGDVKLSAKGYPQFIKSNQIGEIDPNGKLVLYSSYYPSSSSSSASASPAPSTTPLTVPSNTTGSGLKSKLTQKKVDAIVKKHCKK